MCRAGAANRRARKNLGRTVAFWTRPVNPPCSFSMSNTADAGGNQAQYLGDLTRSSKSQSNKTQAVWQIAHAPSDVIDTGEGASVGR